MHLPSRAKANSFDRKPAHFLDSKKTLSVNYKGKPQGRTPLDTEEIEVN